MLNNDMGTTMRWFFGKVEDRDDPERLGRVRVRAFGIHSSDNSLVPTDTLPWAPIAMPPTSASHAGVGTSPTGILVGSMVWGFFLDGDMCQQPVVAGTWWGAPDGVSDINEIATGGVILERGVAPMEPPDTAAPEYPYNKVTTTESGHVIEIDDTPGATRISFYHNSGTYQEITHNGDGISRVVGDGYDITIGDKTIYIGGDCDLNVQGNLVAKVDGDIDVQAQGSVYVASETEIKGMAPLIEFTEGLTDIDPSVVANFVSMSREGYIVAYDDVDPSEVPEEVKAQFPLAEDITTQVEVVETPESGPERGSPISCLDISFNGSVIPRGHAIYSRNLSPSFTIGALSTNAHYPHLIRAQMGLDVGDIICNLKAVSENILEPIKRRFPSIRINSGFRAGTGRSQHLRGQAIDIQSSSMSNRQHLEMAQWIAANLPFDQLIFEHSNSSGRVWVHVSYDRGKSTQRRDVRTMINGTYPAGLRLHY